MSRKAPLEKNYFYVVYSVDFYALPVAYCESLAELAAYMGKTKLQTSNLLARYRNDPRYKTAAMKTKDGKQFKIIKWHIKGREIEPAYKGATV